MRSCRTMSSCGSLVRTAGPSICMRDQSGGLSYSEGAVVVRCSCCGATHGWRVCGCGCVRSAYLNSGRVALRTRNLRAQHAHPRQSRDMHSHLACQLRWVGRIAIESARRVVRSVDQVAVFSWVRRSQNHRRVANVGLRQKVRVGRRVSYASMILGSPDPTEHSYDRR